MHGAANLLRNQAPAEQVVPALDKAVEQSRRAGQVIRRIYSLTRPSDSHFEAVDLAERVTATAALIEGEMRQRSVRLDHVLQSSLIIDGDPVLIEQILLNLLRNAMDAMRDTPLEQRIIAIELKAADGYALPEIADRGCGIDAAVADNLFDPLFTTKPEGMGMGLAICRSVIESHRGGFPLRRTPAAGRCFGVRFHCPAADDSRRAYCR